MSSDNLHRVSKSTKRTITCDMCKSRHQKCNGGQPRCGNCELRSITCSYTNSSTRTRFESQTISSNKPSTVRIRHLLFCNVTDERPRAESGSKSGMSVVEFNRIYPQVFDQIVHRLQLQSNQNAGFRSDTSIISRSCNAGLPSLHQEVLTIVNQQVMFNSQQLSPGMESGALFTDPLKESSRERDLVQVRKILRSFLPSKEKSQRLLELFFVHQNSIFYICNQTVAQAQLVLMYTDPDQVRISWFCQMLLIFAVAVQFDDLDDGDGESYRETSQKYLDDAIDENPQNTLWVTRAMLLFCFYQPPTKWTSIWMYLDAAIRGAQRFQLDLGQNLPKELPDEEYQEWRQLWLSIISFDRWVAISLGRLPRIKESISRDPIFQDLRIESGLDCCVMQNHITCLAVLSAYILRDVYFSDQFSVSTCREFQNKLDRWVSGLPDPVRQQVRSGVVPELSLGTSDATFNIYFMYHGAWMLLLRPSILRLVKLRTKETSNAGSIGSAILSDARICIDHALRVIDTARAMLYISLPARRSFMPLFFLVSATYIVNLGAVWRLEQSHEDFDQAISCDENHELNAIDESIKILEFCGQRNTFARKYSILVKGLRQKFNKGQSDATGTLALPPSIFNHVVSLDYTQRYVSFQDSPNSLVSITPQSEELVEDTGDSMDQSTIPISSWPYEDNSHPSVSSTQDSIQLWLEDFESFNLSDLSSYDPTRLLYSSDVLGFEDEMSQ